MIVDMLRFEDIRLDITTAELLKDLREAARKVNDLRPLSRDVIEQVQRDILGERVYASNAIEGNTCDLRETIEILKAGHVGADQRRKREATEVLNLGKAIDEIRTLDKSDEHRIEKFLAVHRILLQGVSDSWAGCFRHEGVMIRGAKHQPPDGSLVPQLMEQFFQRFGEHTRRRTSGVGGLGALVDCAYSSVL